MITTKIRSLFQFIEFLHSNIDEFNKYNYLIDELDELYDKRNKLDPCMWSKHVYQLGLKLSY